MSPTEEQLQKIAEATKNELYTFEKDPLGEVYGWMCQAEETHETLSDFESSSNDWAERTVMNRGQIAGFEFIAWSKMQSRKGQPRDSLSVIDFGDVRVAMHGTDLTYFQ